MKDFLQSMRRSKADMYDKGKVNFEELNPSLDFNSVWIDGGNSEIFGSPGYSLQLLKIAATIWEKDKKKEDVVHTLFAFAEETKLKIDGDYGHDVADLINETVEGLETPQQAVELLRRCLELKISGELKEKYPENIVCIDGSLIVPTKAERYLLKDGVIGVVKSSSQSEKGRSLNLMLERLAPYDSWVVRDMVVSKTLLHDASIHFAKLHSKAKTIVRLEGKDVPVDNIAALSKDPVFFGYPYPLIKADELARVSNEERDFQKTKALVLAKELGLDLEKEDLVKGSHGVLDSVKF